mmetsp:Transcript_15465/g.37167  ORF Transcript_15465/g.37167 Transcript_15465/m.37167 type:complete len:139 (-) Transcript_15465:235-651(-)
MLHSVESWDTLDQPEPLEYRRVISCTQVVEELDSGSKLFFDDSESEPSTPTNRLIRAESNVTVDLSSPVARRSPEQRLFAPEVDVDRSSAEWCPWFESLRDMAFATCCSTGRWYKTGPSSFKAAAHAARPRGLSTLWP